MRNKRNRKLMSILLTLSMLVTLLVPMVGPAAASSTYTANSVVNVSANTFYNGTFNRVIMEMPSGSLTGAATFRMSLPIDFATTLTATPAPNGATFTNQIALAPVLTPIGSPVNTVAGNTYREWDITINTTGAADKGMLYIDFANFTVPSGKSGDIKATFDAPPGTSVSSGDVVIAQIGTGVVSLAMDDVNTVTTTGGTLADILVKEDRAGALVKGSTSVKIKLPSGFSWTTGNASATAIWSTSDAAVIPANANLTLADNGRTLQIANPKGAGSTAASYYRIHGLSISVDESVAKTGDIIGTVSGDSSISTSSLTVGKYGDFSVTVSAFGDPKAVRAGRADEEIGKIAIEESVAASLVDQRTITLQLTGGAVWHTFPNIDAADSKNTNGLNWSWVGSNNDTIKAIVNGSASAAKYVLEKASVDLSGSADGDIKVIVGGTAGAAGEALVAKATKPVTASIDGQPANVTIGDQSFEIPPVIVAENQAEAIDASTSRTSALKSGVRSFVNAANQTVYYIDADGSRVYTAGETTLSSTDAFVTTSTTNNQLFLEFPMDVQPSVPTKVEVIEGDIVLDNNSIARNVTADGRWYVSVNIKSTSSQPAKIKFSGIKATLSRTVPTGDLKVAVKGSALLQTLASFPGVTSIASVKVANVVTPAPGDQRATAVFKIGDAKFTLNGVDQTMDAAPYLKNDRTYLPIRFVAQAVGVSDSNILWNSDDQSVTLIKSGSVVRLVVGSTTMTINGTPIIMDTAPEIVDPGRTMLPVSWVAKALGANIAWDAATQTVTVK